jgi:hypothetical protein
MSNVEVQMRVRTGKIFAVFRENSAGDVSQSGAKYYSAKLSSLRSTSIAAYPLFDSPLAKLFQ